MKPYELPRLDYESVEKQIRDFIRVEAKDRGAVIGLSGGVDSAAAAALSVRALGKEKVLALIMPEAGSSVAADEEDAMSLVHQLGIAHRKVEITDATKTIIDAIGTKGTNIVEGNLKARVRMGVLYYFANLENRLVVGSGDKSELSVGYFTKYGDGGVDILPIGGLYKTQVRELARHLGIPPNIAQKESSPRLWPAQTAEEELGLDYGYLDCILHLYIDHSYDRERVINDLGEDSRLTVDKVIAMVKKNAHKMKPPPMPRILQAMV